MAGYDPYRNAGGCEFVPEAAQRVIDFFAECLCHIEGARAGQPFVLEPWQQAIIGNMFGWLRPDGTRRYREALIYVPKKNGKTPMAAGIALYLLMCDGEAGAQVYSAAADRDQAALVFRWAAGMASYEPEIMRRLKVYRTYKSIEHPSSGSVFRSLSHEAPAKHGLNISGLLVDELHAHPTPELAETLAAGTASRRQPLVVYTTTADFARESVCNAKYGYACRVRDGAIEDAAFLPVIYEALESDDWRDPATWAKANPNLGVSVTEEFFRREANRAEAEPAYLNTFLRLHLNVRTTSDVAWIAPEAWNGCAGAVDPEALRGHRCYAGLDLASTQDLTALVLVFPDDGNAVLPFFFVPEETARKREAKALKPSYVAWKQHGWMEFTPGNVCDYSFVRAKVKELAAAYDIREIAYDPWGAQQLATDLQGDGLVLTQMRQGFASLSAPSKELEKLLLGGQMRHGGHPVLRWCAANVMVETDAAGNIKPSKAKSGDKIDGIVALVMALGLSIANAEVEWSPEVFTA